MFFWFFFLFFIAIIIGRYKFVKTSLVSNQEFGFKLSIFFIIFISSMRFNIGYDWAAYLSFVYPYFSPKYLVRHEPFDLVIYIIAGSLRQPWIMFSIFAIITYSLIGKTIFEYSYDKYESLMIYICLYFLSGLSTIRQEIAVAIVFYGYRFIIQKKKYKYFITVIIAMCFHKTAIISLLFYPLYYLNLKEFLLALFGFCCFVRLLLPSIVEYIYPPFMAYLVEGGIVKSSGRLQRLFLLLILIYLLIKHNNINSNKGLLKICIIGCILPFILGSHTGIRLSEYFLIYYVLIIPECNRRFSIKYKFTFLIPFYMYFFFYLFTSVYINHSKNYVPFRWYFLESLYNL